MAAPGFSNGTTHWYADTRWFHMLRAMVSSGDLATLSGMAVKVYLAIKAATDLETGIAEPDLQGLAQQTGASTRQVLRALQELEQVGYLTHTHHGRKNQYRILEKLRIDDAQGTPAGQAMWEYIPGAMQEAMREVHKVVKSEVLDGTPVVFITLQVNIAQDQATVINMQECLDKIKDPDLRAAIMGAMNRRPAP
jgi:hypothetical protein